MAYLTYDVPFDISYLGPVRRHRLFPSHDASESDYQSWPTSEEYNNYSYNFHGPICQRCGTNFPSVQPHVTVNVVANGGSSAGGAGGRGGLSEARGGNGIGGDATFPGGGFMNHVDPDPRLEAQLADLSGKIDQLSSRSVVPHLLVETGARNRSNRARDRWYFRKRPKQPRRLSPIYVYSLGRPRDQNWVYATDVGPEGFTTNADSWNGPQLYS